MPAIVTGADVWTVSCGTATWSVSPAPGAVTELKVSATAPIVSVVATTVAALADDVWRTQTVWLLLIGLSAVDQVVLQGTDDSLPAAPETVAVAPLSMPVIVTG